ncbi:MAG: hypothetical protein K2J04_14275, partial [Lachnospiraceae bacterium]|nr:hypothetical protein [Lachnospiraceae bacterium]
MTLSLTACAVTAKGIAPKEEETVEESAEAEETEPAVEDSEDEPEADFAEDDSESEDAVADAAEEDADEEEEKEETSGRYEKGTVTGTSFESEWIGLRYDMPDGFTMATEEELDAILKLGSEIIYEDNADMIFDYAKMTMVYEMMAVDPSNNSVTILVERAAGKPEDFVKMVEAQLAGVDGIEMKLADVDENARIGDMEFYKFSYDISSNGVNVYQDYYLLERNGRMIEILVSYADESIREIMMDGFSPY